MAQIAPDIPREDIDMIIRSARELENALDELINEAFVAVDAGSLTKDAVIACLEEALQQVRSGEYDAIHP